MQYYSLNNHSIKADFKAATLAGQAPDGGLYFPENIPFWEKTFIQDLSKLSKAEIGMRIMQPFVGGSMNETTLLMAMEETLAFDFPLKRINESMFILELFHGPTLAFKDLGARFLSRCMGAFANDNGQKVNILVATSGDTGGAVADAFHGVAGTEVFILYPSGKVSPVQEKQLTTYGNNIHAFEVQGDFDDCQRMVKQAFQDQELMKKAMLTSSNSINIARWLSQQVYYALALAQWQEDTPPVISVPSGNFGNLCAGLTAWQSGLPAEHFIAACNANNAFTSYIGTGVFQPKSSIATLSNAMDVGVPSNFIRILELFQHEHHQIRKIISSESISDNDTVVTMSNVFHEHNYIMDPHSAVAYKALANHIHDHPQQKGILLGTAHPVKFPDVVEKAIGTPPDAPLAIEKLLKMEKKSMIVPTDFQLFKEILQKYF
jgi:threonine synthase